jgi:hypothetical protein
VVRGEQLVEPSLQVLHRHEPLGGDLDEHVSLPCGLW